MPGLDAETGIALGGLFGLMLLGFALSLVAVRRLERENTRLRRALARPKNQPRPTEGKVA